MTDAAASPSGAVTRSSVVRVGAATAVSALCGYAVLYLAARDLEPAGFSVFSVFWGAFACAVAIYAATLGSLIEVVNRFGSFFYGSILGVFLLAMMPRAVGRGSFFGLLVGMGVVAAVAFGAPDVSYLWHNVIGAVTVVIVGLLLGGKEAEQEA